MAIEAHRRFLVGALSFLLFCSHESLAESPDETLSVAEISHVADAYTSQVRSCWEAHSKQVAGGQVRVEMIINPGGKVWRHSWKFSNKRLLRNKPLIGCLDALVEQWQLPGRKGYTNAVVPYYMQRTVAKGAGPYYGCPWKRGCPSKKGEPVTTTDSPEVAKPPEGTADTRDLKGQMADHFQEVQAIQLAVVLSDLGHAKERAGVLATMQVNLGTSWRPYVERVTSRALRLQQAKDLRQAGRLVTQIGAECANCHAATGAITNFAWSPQPSDDGSAIARMDRHQWAARRLWEGLVAPADERWNEGAAALAETPLPVDALTNNREEQATVGALSQKLVTRAQVALKAKNAGERTASFSSLLEVCSACHSVARH